MVEEFLSYKSSQKHSAGAMHYIKEVNETVSSDSKFKYWGNFQTSLKLWNSEMKGQIQVEETTKRTSPSVY